MTKSFFQHSDIIQDGDLVLAWIMRTNVRTVKVERGDGAINTRFGAFPFNQIIGLPYGSQISSDSNKGFIYVLRPNPELWTLSLPHRTQIVYTPDSSYIIQRMNVRPGSVVIEAGTGSGSFSHAFARAVGTQGRLFTYEFHLQRYEEASREFLEHGMIKQEGSNEGMVNITHRDVCKDGFQIDLSDPNSLTSITKPVIPGNVHINATSVFLDLPSPWDAIPHLLEQEHVAARNRIVHICCFSPCIEQVSRTIESLKENGFSRIEMVEVSAKRWEAHETMVKDVTEAMDKLKDIKDRRDRGLAIRNARIQEERDRAKDNPEATNPDTKSEPFSKRIRLESDSNDNGNDIDEDEKESRAQPRGKGNKYNPWGKGEARVKEGDERFKWASVTQLEPEIKTHTSYLTFAILPPSLQLA